MIKSLKANAVLNAIRQSLAIVFPLITLPYALRVLGSAEYGKYTFSASIVNYFSLLATFGINSYAVREGARIRNDKEKLNQMASDLFTFNIITALFSFSIMVVLTFGSHKLYDYRILIIVQGFCIFLSTIGADWINTIYEDFLYITVRYIIIQIIALFAVFVFVNSSKDTIRYCFILVSASYGGNLINLFYIRKYVHLRVNWRVKLKKYILPLSVLFINSLATVIYVNSDITMLGFYSTDSNVGIYSFSSKIYNTIKHFINAIMVVTVPRLAYLKESDENKYNEHINSIFNILILILLPITVGIFMLSDSIIMIVGGKKYLQGEMALKVLSFSLIFALLSSVFTNCILVINRLEKRCLVATVLSAIINIALNIILIPRIGIMGAALTTVIAELINMIIQAFYSNRDLNTSFKLEFNTCFSLIVGSISVMLVCAFVNKVLVLDGILYACMRIGISFIVSAICYLLILCLFRNNVIVRIRDRKF